MEPGLRPRRADRGEGVRQVPWRRARVLHPAPISDGSAGLMAVKPRSFYIRTCKETARNAKKTGEAKPWGKNNQRPARCLCLAGRCGIYSWTPVGRHKRILLVLFGFYGFSRMCRPRFAPRCGAPGDQGCSVVAVCWARSCSSTSSLSTAST